IWRRIRRVRQLFRTKPESGAKRRFQPGTGPDPARALSPAHSRRSYDRTRRMGYALGAGRSGLDKLGRQGRLRRLLVIQRHGARRLHQVLGLVMMNSIFEHRSSGLRRAAKSSRGFTMMELMV